MNGVDLGITDSLLDRQSEDSAKRNVDDMEIQSEVDSTDDEEKGKTSGKGKASKRRKGEK